MTREAGLRSVAMFVHRLDGRAVSRVALTLCEQLAAMGLEATLLCTGRDTDPGIKVPDGVNVDVLGIEGRRLTLGLRHIAAWLRARRPDVLFAHLNGPGRAAVLARAMARVPTRVVVVEHTHYSTFGWDHRWLRDPLIALLYPMADRVAGVSPAVVEDLAARFPGVRGRTAVVPEVGPDPDAIAARSQELPDHPWFRDADTRALICNVANVVPRKGQDTLVEALPLVREALGDVRLVLVGRFDDPEFVARLKQSAERLGVREHVSLVGYCANALPYIAHAQVFAHGSWTEGCPIVLAEAMACGTPVVAADSPGGASYVLDGGRCGILVPLRNAAEMARGLISVLRDSELRNTLITQGRRRASHFSPRAVAEAYRALAQVCLDEVAPPPVRRPSDAP
jgi:glycosyltransferase involved in cell wall biosynthesis